MATSYELILLLEKIKQLQKRCRQSDLFLSKKCLEKIIDVLNATESAAQKHDNLVYLQQWRPIWLDPTSTTNAYYAKEHAGRTVIYTNPKPPRIYQFSQSGIATKIHGKTTDEFLKKLLAPLKPSLKNNAYEISRLLYKSHPKNLNRFNAHLLLHGGISLLSQGQESLALPVGIELKETESGKTYCSQTHVQLGPYALNHVIDATLKKLHPPLDSDTFEKSFVRAYLDSLHEMYERPSDPHGFRIDLNQLRKVSIFLDGSQKKIIRSSDKYKNRSGQFLYAPDYWQTILKDLQNPVKNTPQAAFPDISRALIADYLLKLAGRSKIVEASIEHLSCFLILPKEARPDYLKSLPKSYLTLRNMLQKLDPDGTGEGKDLLVFTEGDSDIDNLLAVFNGIIQRLKAIQAKACEPSLFSVCLKEAWHYLQTLIQALDARRNLIEKFLNQKTLLQICLEKQCDALLVKYPNLHQQELENSVVQSPQKIKPQATPQKHLTHYGLDFLTMSPNHAALKKDEPATLETLSSTVKNKTRAPTISSHINTVYQNLFGSSPARVAVYATDQDTATDISLDITEDSDGEGDGNKTPAHHG